MEILTAKHVMHELGISRTKALQYLKDMKEYYNTPSGKVTKLHLYDYFGINKLNAKDPIK